MTLKYESELLFDLMKRDGDDAPSDVLPYESELKEKYLNQVVGAYPKLQDYQPEWLNYNLYHHLPSDFPVESVANVTSASFNNVVPYAYKSAILKGNTKYRDIDTGDILDTFDETKNLELVSVKMPVLTTSNEDGTKTNILTCNDEVELRGIGEAQDTLDCLTGKLTQRIGEVVFDGGETLWNLNYESDSVAVFQRLRPNDAQPSNLSVNSIKCDKLPVNDPISALEEGIRFYNGNGQVAIGINKSRLSEITNVGLRLWLQSNPVTVAYPLATESVKTVDLRCINEQGESETLRPIEGTMHVNTSSQTLPPLLDMSVPVEATTQNLMSFANIEGEE